MAAHRQRIIPSRPRLEQGADALAAATFAAVAAKAGETAAADVLGQVAKRLRDRAWHLMLPAPPHARPIEARTAGGVLADALADAVVRFSGPSRAQTRSVPASLAAMAAAFEKIVPSSLARWRFQPRVPAGNPEGGQWSDGSHWSAGGGFDIADAIYAPEEDTAPYTPAFDGDSLLSEHDAIDDALLLLIGARKPRNPKDSDLLKRAYAIVKEAIEIADTSILFELSDLARHAIEVRYEIITALYGPRTFEEMRLTDKYEEFSTFEEMTNRYSCSAGMQMHHIVPQHRYNLEKFGYYSDDGNLHVPAIHNTHNVVCVPTVRHFYINGLYNSKDGEYGGISLREFSKDLSKEEQRALGILMMLRAKALKAPD